MQELAITNGAARQHLSLTHVLSKKTSLGADGVDFRGFMQALRFSPSITDHGKDQWDWETRGSGISLCR